MRPMLYCFLAGMIVVAAGAQAKSHKLQFETGKGLKEKTTLKAVGNRVKVHLTAKGEVEKDCGRYRLDVEVRVHAQDVGDEFEIDPEVIVVRAGTDTLSLDPKFQHMIDSTVTDFDRWYTIPLTFHYSGAGLKERLTAGDSLKFEIRFEDFLAHNWVIVGLEPVHVLDRTARCTEE